MKSMTKMTKMEVAVFCLMAVMSGCTLGISGTASLLAANLFGSAGKVVGACLFALGIYVIITFEMKLFTGMVAGIPKMPVKDYWQLVACFIGNMIGVAIVALIVAGTGLGETVIPQGQAVIEAKFALDNWALNSFCSSILCGALITFSVWSPKYAPQKGISASVGVLLPIIVFVFCGFDHSVANMFYFYFFGEVSGRVVAYILLSILGNIVGGVALPLVILLKEKATERKNKD